MAAPSISHSAETPPSSTRAVSSGAQYRVNLRTHGVVVTLINNDGVTKEPRKKPVIDRTKDRVISVRYTGDRRVKSANDLRRQTHLTLNSRHEVAVPVHGGSAPPDDFPAPDKKPD